MSNIFLILFFSVYINTAYRPTKQSTIDTTLQTKPDSILNQNKFKQILLWEKE